MVRVCVCVIKTQQPYTLLQDVTGTRSSSAVITIHVTTTTSYSVTFSLSLVVRSVYKHHLLLTTENQKLDLEYKKLKMKKLKLEIKKLEKEVSMNLKVI